MLLLASELSSKLRTVQFRHLATALSHSYPSASADSSALLLLQLTTVSPNLFSSGTMSGFSFVVDYHGTLTPAQNAARRGPDYLVRVPNDHPLFGIGSAYFRFRQDGAAAPPAGAAAVVAVIPDCMALGLLEGHVEDAVIGPPGNVALYGCHCFQPEFLGRAVDMAVSGLGEEVSGIGVLIGLIRALKENCGLVAQPADLVALAPHSAVGPLPAAASAAAENPGDPAAWNAPFALSSSAFNDLADENGFMGTYAALRLASGVAGVTAERRGEPFATAARILQGSLLASA